MKEETAANDTDINSQKKCTPLGQREMLCYVLYDPLFCECCDNVWKHYECNEDAVCGKCGAKFRDGNITILPLA